MSGALNLGNNVLPLSKITIRQPHAAEPIRPDFTCLKRDVPNFCLSMQFREVLTAYLDFALLLARGSEVVGELHLQPGLRRAAKGLR
jgi:hypothetical protein